MIDKDKIRNVVSKALDYQFEIYSWMNMIDDIQDLTSKEKEWAKEHTTYKLDMDE